MASSKLAAMRITIPDTLTMVSRNRLITLYICIFQICAVSLLKMVAGFLILCLIRSDFSNSLGVNTTTKLFYQNLGKWVTLYMFRRIF